MSAEPPVSEWAIDQFGDSAGPVQKAVARSLVDSHHTARDSQAASRMQRKNALGGNWPKIYENLVTNLADMPDAQVGKPRGASVKLVAIRGNLLLPFRHADNVTTPLSDAKLTTKLAEDVFACFRRWLQADATLFDDIDLASLPQWSQPVLAEAGRPPKVILVPFAGNADAPQLLAAWWGEGIRTEAGYVRWIYAEKLVLDHRPPPSTGGVVVEDPRGPWPSGPVSSAQTFNDGEPPSLDFPQRPREASE